MLRRLVCLMVLLATFGTGIVAPVTAQDDPPAVERDYWPTEEWRVSTPEAHGMDPQHLEDMFEYIEKHNIDVQGLVVVRHGYIVVERYYDPYTATTRHLVASVAKSITSILIGIAMQQGYIESVDQRVVDIFADRDIANLDAYKQAMTLEDLLSMTAGFACFDDDDTTNGRMRRSPDWVQFMLNLPMSDEPGTRFNYCDGVAHVLSGMIQETTGVNALDFAYEHLFSKIGIEGVTWNRDPQGNPNGGFDLYMTPRDMARIGYLYLNNGMWDSEQIVSPEWVAASVSEHSHNGASGYGYLWWVASPDEFRAAGHGAQFIIVRPDADLVVVFTSDIQSHNSSELNSLLTYYILGSISAADLSH